MSTNKVIPPLPLRPSLPLLPLRLQKLPDIQLPQPRPQIHLARPPHPRLVPPLIVHKHDEHDRRRQISEEEALDLAARAELLIAHRPRARPELRDEDEHVEDEADPAPGQPGLRDERQLVERVALQGPGPAEADVAETDRSPGEDARQAGERQHPVQHRPLISTVRAVRDESKRARDRDRDDRPALAVDVAQDLGRLALVRERGERARTAEDGAVADGEDGDQDHDVHHGGQDRDARVFDGDDEGRGGGVGAAVFEEALVVVRHQETDERQAHDVK